MWRACRWGFGRTRTKNGRETLRDRPWPTTWTPSIDGLSSLSTWKKMFDIFTSRSIVRVRSKQTASDTVCIFSRWRWCPVWYGTLLIGSNPFLADFYYFPLTGRTWRSPVHLVVRPLSNSFYSHATAFLKLSMSPDQTTFTTGRSL